jgi:hypothetical protein
MPFLRFSFPDACGKKHPPPYFIYKNRDEVKPGFLFLHYTMSAGILIATFINT